jgi:hypothetical protein
MSIGRTRGGTWSTFDGDTFDQLRDGSRLESQLERVREFMSDGRWHTLLEIAEHTWCSEAGASARLRDLRKPKFGAHRVEREHVQDGLWKYRLLPPDRSGVPAPAKPTRPEPQSSPTIDDMRAAVAEIERLIEFRRSWVASYTPPPGLSVVKGWLESGGPRKVRA